MTALPHGFFGGGDAREVSPGTFFIPAFANSAALSTPEGILLVDCGLQIAGEGIRQRLRALTEAPVAAVVFTHGHVDHAFGIGAFDEEAEAAGRARPRRYAHRMVNDRFQRYARTRAINEHINRTQFGVAGVPWPESYPTPDETYDERHTLELGGERFELRHALGETDDATWVWAPARKVLLTGDLFIWSSPNCGNPQKVQRFAEGWADALDEMRTLGAEVLLPGHGPPIEGREAVDTALGQTSRWLRSLVEQTLERMARGERADDIACAVRPPPDLEGVPYLEPRYDRPEFVVRNVMRLHGGWWNGNPADLLPATEAARAGEIARLAGGVAALCTRARALLQSDPALACHLAEWAVLAAPGEPEALRTKREVFATRAASEPSLMARNIFLAAAAAAQRGLDTPSN